MNKLTLVPTRRQPQEQKRPARRACFKMTFWLSAPEYIQYMRAASLARLSATKYLIKALGLENAAEEEGQRLIQAALAKMNTPPAWFRKERPARARRSVPRSAAARIRRAA